MDDLDMIKGGLEMLGKKKRKKELVGSNGVNISKGNALPKAKAQQSDFTDYFRPFTNHKVKLNAGDSVYFFSDGLPDQFGGPEELKYGPKRIRDLITDNPDQSMEQMAQTMQDDFENWSKESPQIDDVLMIGIRF